MMATHVCTNNAYAYMVLVKSIVEVSIFYWDCCYEKNYFAVILDLFTVRGTGYPSHHIHEHGIFILVANQLDAQNMFYSKFISCLYMFRAPRAHRQEVKIVLYSVWYHHTYRCDDTRGMPLHVSSTTCSSSGGQNCIIQPLVSLHL